MSVTGGVRAEINVSKRECEISDNPWRGSCSVDVCRNP